MDPQQERQKGSTPAGSSGEPEFNLRAFLPRFGPPSAFDFGELLSTGASGASAQWQIAGHSGFLTGGSDGDCYKPVNPICARGRRELMFYQLVNYFKFRHSVNSREQLYYDNFKIFTNPEKPCDCRIDPETFRTLHRYMPRFKALKHLVLDGDDFVTNEDKQNAYFDKIYNPDPLCSCYYNDKILKEGCYLEFDTEDYLRMDDLEAHCSKACKMDIKMGKITYDPLAGESKKDEQTEKFPKLGDFGFRIIGVKIKDQLKDKSFGLGLDSKEKVRVALETYFEPLQSSDYKAAVIGKMLDILEEILEWFETKNDNQLRFYASSLLFVYDAALVELQEPRAIVLDKLMQSVRLCMIDFAHVFHSHDPPSGPSRSGSSSSSTSSTMIRPTEPPLNKDDNYLYGLRRLIKYLIMMNREHKVKIVRDQNKEQLSLKKSA